MGLYWEYCGTVLGMGMKIYRRENAGNEAGMGMKGILKTRLNIMKINDFQDPKTLKNACVFGAKRIFLLHRRLCLLVSKKSKLAFLRTLIDDFEEPLIKGVNQSPLYKYNEKILRGDKNGGKKCPPLK